MTEVGNRMVQKKWFKKIIKSNDPKEAVQLPLTIENVGSSNWPLMEDVFDLAQIAIWEWDVEKDTIHGTRQLYEIFGTRPGDYNDRLMDSLDALVHPEQKSYVQMVIKESLKNGGIDRFKFRIVRRDGQERWLMVKARLQADGKTATGLILDCSQSQRTELTLYRDLDFIQTLMDTIPNPIFYKDAQGTYQFCNRAFAQTIGTHVENIIGKSVFDISREELAELYHQKDLELMHSGGVQEYEAKVQVSSGEERTYRFHKAPYKDLRGTPVGLVGVMTDITETAAALSRNQRLAQMKEAMLEVSHSIIGLHDTRNLLEILLDKAMNAIPFTGAGSVLMIDEAGYLRMLVSRGYSKDGAEDFKLKIEETFTYRISGGCFEEPFIVNHIHQLVSDGCLKPLTTQDGRMIASNLSTPIKVEGEPVALVIVDSFEDEVFTSEDIELMGYLKVQAELALTNLKLYQDTLRLSRYDHLTGVCNRGYFDSVLGALIERTAGLPHRFTFVMMDLDGLKSVNDQLGHREGDFRLQEFSRMFQKILGEEDILGRYGGDEFVAVFFGKAEEEVRQSVDRLLQVISEGSDRYCSFSYGMAQYPEEGSNLEELVRRADRRLYVHKKEKYFGRRREDRGDTHQ